MTEPRRDTNWWGWGDPTRRTELDATALGVLRERIGDGYPAGSAISRVLEEPYYVEGLTSATNVLKGDTGVLDDFRSIDSL